MAAYSYLHPTLFLDSANFLIQNSTTTNHHNPVTMMSGSSFEEQTCHDIINSNNSSSYYPSADNYQPLHDLVIFHTHERSSGEENNSRSSSDTDQSLTTNDNNIHKETKTTDKKRKNTIANDKSCREGSCLSSGVSKFLSMKLASVNPIFYDYGGDLDALMVKSENQNYSSGSIPMPSNDQQQYNSCVQFQQSQVPNSFCRGNENNLLMDMDHEQIPNTFIS
ncbi:hypothetical protein MKX01_032533 [Papaver californicum]|nr:hypothetical protein MKX01_032533 [Papaver californicum]